MTGGSTYIISLPKAWIDQLNLKRGSVVKIHQTEDTSLNLLPRDLEIPEKYRKLTLRIFEDDTPDSVVRKLVSAYLLGYSVIEIRSTQKRLDVDVRKKLKNHIHNKMIGTEIMNDVPNQLDLQILLSYSDLSIRDALKRMALIVASMHREAITALSQENTQLAKEIINTDDEVDRFNLYLVRLLKTAVSDANVLKKSGIASAKNCIDYRLVVKSIERTADHAVNIAQNCLSLTMIPIDKAILSDLENLSESALRIFEAAMESIYEDSYENANQVLDMANETLQNEDEVIHRIIKKAPIEDVSYLRLIVESIKRTVEYGADIAEMVLNMNIDKVSDNG